MMTINKLIQVIAYSLSANVNNYTLHFMHPEYGLRSHDSVSMCKTTCSAYQHLTDETGWRCWVYVVCVMTLSLSMDVFLLARSTPVLRCLPADQYLRQSISGRAISLNYIQVPSKPPFSNSHNKHLSQSKSQISETHITL